MDFTCRVKDVIGLDGIYSTATDILDDSRKIICNANQLYKGLTSYPTEDYSKSYLYNRLEIHANADSNISVRVNFLGEIVPYIQDGIYDRSSYVNMEGTFMESIRYGKITVDGTTMLDSTGDEYIGFTPGDIYFNNPEKGYIDIEIEVQSYGGGYFAIYKPVVRQTKEPTVREITAPVPADGEKYAYGQIIPITVRFNEPVISEGLKMVVNGQELPAVGSEDGAGYFGYRQTFLYTVPLTGNTFLNMTASPILQT